MLMKYSQETLTYTIMYAWTSSSGFLPDSADRRIFASAEKLRLQADEDSLTVFLNCDAKVLHRVLDCVALQLSSRSSMTIGFRLSRLFKSLSQLLIAHPIHILLMRRKSFGSRVLLVKLFPHVSTELIRCTLIARLQFSRIKVGVSRLFNDLIKGSYNPGWDSRNDRIRGNILRHNAARSNNGIGADRNSIENRRTCANKHIVTDVDASHFFRDLEFVLHVVDYCVNHIVRDKFNLLTDIHIIVDANKIGIKRNNLVLKKRMLAETGEQLMLANVLCTFLIIGQQIQTHCVPKTFEFHGK